MRPSLKLLALSAVLLVVPMALGANAAPVKPTLTQVIRTFEWNHPSPDPMGLTYRPKTKSIFVVDSEVEETPYWVGTNIWEIGRGGVVLNEGKTTKFSVEPADIAYNAVSRHFFFVDDDLDKVFNVGMGADHKIGTADDQVKSFSTAAFGSRDAEGLGFGDGALFITDGVGQFVFRLTPGPNQVFDGVAPEGDDVVVHFGTVPLGLHDPEDVDYNGVSGHLFIISRTDKVVAETTKGGILKKTFDLSDSQILQPGGITLAPGTDGSAKALFVADRGYDNNLHPNENDGRIFEFRRVP
jgi:hypothetical protein